MSSLEDQIPAAGVKRTQSMRPSEIMGKLSSKRDWYTYLEQHL